MDADLRNLLDFLRELGIEKVAHTQKTYLGHLVNVYRLMKDRGCTEELCQAGLFHSIYGTERFQNFKLPLDRRAEVRALIGDYPERLAFWNCAMDRGTFDQALQESGPSYRVRDRITGEEWTLTSQELDDLARVHLFDWLEQVPRSRFGWDYRRSAYRRMAERLGGAAQETYDAVFAQEPPAFRTGT